MFTSHEKYGTTYDVYKVEDPYSAGAYVFQGGQVPKPVTRMADRLTKLAWDSDKLAIVTIYRKFGSSYHYGIDGYGYSEMTSWWLIDVTLDKHTIGEAHFSNDTEYFYIPATKIIPHDHTRRSSGIKWMTETTRQNFNRRMRGLLK